MSSSNSEVLVGRRYLERGFLDAAMKLMVRNAELVEAADWVLLAERLMERNRVTDVVSICELGGIPLPRKRMLELGDAHLKRRDVDSAIRIYELVGADDDRWLRMLDVLTALPERQRQAIAVVERHLGTSTQSDAPRHIRVVK